MARDTIFISHATPHDNEFVRWLGAQLNAQGYTVWADVFQLKGGTPFWNTIEEVLRHRAIKTIFVVSRHSVDPARSGVRNELSVADGLRKSLPDPAFIVPVRIDDTPFDELPILIHQLNTLDFAENRDLSLSSLIDALEGAGVPKSAATKQSDGRAAADAVAKEPPLRGNAVAVLPFENLSGDPEQAYFADGMVDELITALSRFRSFAVIARNSSFAHRGRVADVREVARTLRARYLLSGSVRRGGNRLRLAVQLVDGADNATLWAQTFEGALDEVFEFQDRITHMVASAIEPQIQKAELDRSRRERPNSLAAYDLYLRAVAGIYSFTPEGCGEASRLLDLALELEPGNGVFLASAAWALELRFSMGWPPLGSNDKQRCVDFAHRAVERAPADAAVLSHSGIAMQLVGGEYERGLMVAMRAAELNPNDSIALTNAGVAQLVGGSLDEARRLFHRAIDLQPNAGDAMGAVSNVYAALGQHEEAISWASRAIAIFPNYQPSHWVMVACNAYLGRMDAAHEALRVLLELVPTLTVEKLDAVGSKDRNGILQEGLRLAGLRER